MLNSGNRCEVSHGAPGGSDGQKRIEEYRNTQQDIPSKNSRGEFFPVDVIAREWVDFGLRGFVVPACRLVDK